MKHTPIAIAIALTGALSACGPLGLAGLPTPATSPAASKKPKDDAEPKKPATPVVPTAVAPSAAGILGKMKEPLALARQSAFVASLHDVLPVSLASGGLGVLGDATTLVSNNGGSLVANNGGGLITDNGAGLISDKGGAAISNGGAAYRLLQEVGSVTTWERRGLVMVQHITSSTTGRLSIFDGEKWNRTPGADNEGALIDRFDFVVENIQSYADGTVSGDFVLTIVSSKRIPFVDSLVVRQHNRLDGLGGFEVVKFEYLLGFDVKLADGAVDHADLLLVTESGDLVREKALDGRELPGTETPARMALGGSNGHGNYKGEVKFPPGGAIEGAFTHERPDGAKTSATFALRPDGGTTQEASSASGQLGLKLDRGADGRRAFEVRDLAGAAPKVLPDAVEEAGGIATFDFGTPEKPRARLY